MENYNENHFGILPMIMFIVLGALMFSLSLWQTGLVFKKDAEKNVPWVLFTLGVGLFAVAICNAQLSLLGKILTAIVFYL